MLLKPEILCQLAPRNESRSSLNATMHSDREIGLDCIMSNLPDSYFIIY